MERDRELRELQEELSKLRQLVDSAGYGYIRQIAVVQIKTRLERIYKNPLKSMDETLEQEYLKGEVQGIETFMELPAARLMEVERDIEEILSDIEAEEKSHDRTDD